MLKPSSAVACPVPSLYAYIPSYCMEAFVPPDTARPHWMPALDPAGAPLYLQIAGALEAAVADGALRPGDRLPPQRLLAGTLGVDLTTITRAYDEARRRRLLDAVTGRGSFVAARGTHPDETIDLGMNIPPAPRGLSLAELIGRDVASLLRGTDADRLMTYHVGPGNEVDRAAGALWLEPLLGKLPVGRIVIAPGAQAALAAVLSLRAKAGDTILAERLTYPGLLSAAAHLGVRVVGIETDGEGPLPQALEAACRLHAPRLVYLLPTIHNPTSVTTPEPRRRDIVRIAARMRLPILEDDPYSLLAGQTSGRGAPPAFATLLPQQTTYIATVSKTLTPGLRQAYVVLPVGEGGEALVGALRALDLMPAPLMTALLTRWIREGTAARILEAVRTEAALRQRLAAELLPATASAHRYGLHVWQPLPPTMRADQAEPTAAACGRRRRRRATPA